MKFYSYADAVYYRNRHHPRHKYKVVKTQHWSMEKWGWVSCWTVVIV